jgi:DNA-binding transcriptional LysR family regulator
MALIEHLEKIRHFHKMTQNKSINETSKKTGYSQAGLSKSLHLLELELGCRLFKRSREGLSLTKEGIEVLEFSETLIDLTASLERKLRALNSVPAPKILRIGMYDSIAIYFGVELSEYLRQVYPQVKLEIIADTSSNLIEHLDKDSIDLAIGVNFHRQQEKKLKFFKLFEDNYSLYTTSKNLNETIENSIVAHSQATDENGSSTVELFRNEIKGKRVHQVSNFETLKQLTVSGLGVGILPTLVAKPLVQAGQIVPYEARNTKKSKGKHSIGILVRIEAMSSYGDFISDIVRRGADWIKT